jgi:AcrR family transcriptional regulator
MARKTKEEALETRNNILSAAVQVFLEKGVSNASLEMIAEQANVTRGAIYWHFRNKADIFEALQENLHQSLMDIILQDLQKDHPYPLQQLEELCVSLLLDLARNPMKRDTLRIFWLKCDYSGDISTCLDQQNERKCEHKELFARYFDRAIEKGYLKPDTDSSLLTLSVSSYLTGIVYEYLRNPQLFDMEKDAHRLMYQLFAGLAQCCK